MNDSAAGKQVYPVLAAHQVSEPWEFQDLSRDLHRWTQIMNFRFKLEVQQVSLRVDFLSARCLGHFRHGHNGFGLRNEIALNRRYLDRREYWQVLGTLLHELLHAWQEAHGQPGKWNYHNVQFRRKAAEYGLIIDEEGHTEYEPNSPFMDLLRECGVQIPDLPQPLGQRPRRGGSKLKKWSCGCTNVRVAVADFRAQCLRCHNLFVRVD